MFSKMSLLRFSVSHLMRCQQQLSHRLVPVATRLSIQIHKPQRKHFHTTRSTQQKVLPTDSLENTHSVKDLKNFEPRNSKQISVIDQLLADQGDLDKGLDTESDLRELKYGRNRSSASESGLNEYDLDNDLTQFKRTHLKPRGFEFRSGWHTQHYNPRYREYDPDPALISALTQFIAQCDLDASPRVDLDTSPRVDLDTSPRVDLDTSPRVDLDTSPRVYLEMQHGADVLALCIMRLREQSEHDPGELAAWRQCARTLFVLHIPEARGPQNQQKHDQAAVKTFLQDVLDISNVNIRHTVRCKSRHGDDSPGLRVTFDSELTVQRILEEYEQWKNQGHQGRIKLYRSKPLLERKFSNYLRIEKKVRERLSQLRGDPWRWEIKGERVLPKLDVNQKNNLHVLQRLADDYAKRVARFKNLAATDDYEVEAQKKLHNNIILLNVPSSAPAGQRDPREDEQLVRQICDELSVDMDEIQDIQTEHFHSSYSYILPIRLVVPNFFARRAFLEQRAILKEAKDSLMSKIFINLDLTYLQKYMMKNLRDEMKIRNEISRRNNEPFYWIIKRMHVVRVNKEGSEHRSLGQYNILE